MGDRANIFLVPEQESTEDVRGMYLYTHWNGYRWPEALREALVFAEGRWDDEPYLARIIASRVFADLLDSVTGGGLSLTLTDNEYPIIVCDMRAQTVHFATQMAEGNPKAWSEGVSFAEFVAHKPAEYPER